MKLGYIKYVLMFTDDAGDSYKVSDLLAAYKSATILTDALEALSRLGNGERRGNSTGNRMAIVALKQYKEALTEADSDYELPDFEDYPENE